VWCDPKDLRFFSLGHGRFHSQGSKEFSKELALKERDKGDPPSVRKLALGGAYMLPSLGLSRSINFAQTRDHPRAPPPAPFPWSSRYEFVRIQEENIGNPKEFTSYDQGRPSLEHSHRTGQFHM